MRNIPSTADDPAPEFREELSQLIHRHLEHDASSDDIADALKMQTEIVRSRTDRPTEDPRSSTDIDEYRW